MWTRLGVGRVRPSASRCARIRWPVVERQGVWPALAWIGACGHSSSCFAFSHLSSAPNPWQCDLSQDEPPLLQQAQLTLLSAEGHCSFTYLIINMTHISFFFFFLPASYCWKLVWSEPVNHESSNKTVMKPRGSNLTALVAFLQEGRRGPLSPLETKLLPTACAGGSGICIFKLTIKIHLEGQDSEGYSTATHSSYVVSKLVETENGGMAIFYQHSKAEAVFNPLPLLKNLSATSESTHTAQHIWRGKQNKNHQQEHQAN